jgi:hypothetical protein
MVLNKNSFRDYIAVETFHKANKLSSNRCKTIRLAVKIKLMISILSQAHQIIKDSFNLGKALLTHHKIPNHFSLISVNHKQIIN